MAATACGPPGGADEEGAAAGCGAPEGVLDRALRTGTLRVGYVPFPPTVLEEPATGELRGFFVDAMHFIAERMEVQLEFRRAEWSTVLDGLERGDFDVSMAATFRTIPRALRVAFTRPIFFLGDGAVARRGDPRFRRLEDLDARGIVVAVVEGTSSHDLASREFPRATLRVLATSDMRAPLEEVREGRADVGIADAPSTRRFAAEHPEVVDLFGDEPFEVTPVGWAVCPEDHRWLRFLDTALDYVESTGRLERWRARYE